MHTIKSPKKHKKYPSTTNPNSPFPNPTDLFKIRKLQKSHIKTSWHTHSTSYCCNCPSEPKTPMTTRPSICHALLMSLFTSFCPLYLSFYISTGSASRRMTMKSDLKYHFFLADIDRNQTAQIQKNMLSLIVYKQKPKNLWKDSSSASLWPSSHSSFSTTCSNLCLSLRLSSPQRLSLFPYFILCLGLRKTEQV